MKLTIKKRIVRDFDAKLCSSSVRGRLKQMAWSEDCQNEIDRLLAQQGPKEVLAVAITRLIKAKIDASFYNVGIGGMPSCDPAQEVDFCERLLAATIDLFKVKQ